MQQRIDLESVKKRLTDKGLPIDVLMEKFWRIDSYNIVLTVPVFLEGLINFVNEKNSKVDFTKCEFYEFLFNKIFNTRELSKLQLLALEFEKRQLNDFDEKEFRGMARKHEVDIKKLERGGLLQRYDNGKVGFCHHTVSEYLVAEYLVKKEKTIKELRELVLIEEGGKPLVIAFSWCGVIRFLLESNKKDEVRKWMVGLAKENTSVVDEGFSDALTSIDPSGLEPKESSEIFKLVYGIYQKK